ncbi:hypothetical protein BST81_25610 [Leptolyngbya sp. 'hensonii']|uniref:DUF4278 domain-containing protein n=1 Tax=Leptolyngbya sp. 'hensonii' TaxID=1922337 RepID=UPI00094FEDD1|nr:DUF4278 domain-containing protein [Leptolyngbya sp. 'hensonii']OLP15532.1 hypothetical protein BST81_25610 [Leptolyngbya sp. 'hensonii']
MKLIYRGTVYEYDLSEPKAVNPDLFPQAPYTLTYRGVNIQIDPKAPSHQPPAPAECDLIYRGVSYHVSRNTQGAVTTTVKPASKAAAKPVSVPSTLPKQYVSKIHQANLLNNLQHRLEIAREQGNQALVVLLEAEQKQITAWNY